MHKNTRNIPIGAGLKRSPASIQSPHPATCLKCKMLRIIVAIKNCPQKNRSPSNECSDSRFCWRLVPLHSPFPRRSLPSEEVSRSVLCIYLQIDPDAFGRMLWESKEILPAVDL